MTSRRDESAGEPGGDGRRHPEGPAWGGDTPEHRERAGENGRDESTRGTRGLRWGGDGGLRPRTPRPEDDPASPAHRSHREPFRETSRQIPGAPGERGSEPGPLGRPYASFARRGGGWIIDALIKIVLLEIAFAVTGLATVADPFAPQVLLTGQLVSRGYDWLFWSHGWTPGARILGMRIVLEDGRPPGYGPGFIRTMGAVPSEVALAIGYLWMLWDGKRQTWHDKMSGTYVILAPEDERQ